MIPPISKSVHVQLLLLQVTPQKHSSGAFPTREEVNGQGFSIFLILLLVFHLEGLQKVLLTSTATSERAEQAPGLG